MKQFHPPAALVGFVEDSTCMSGRGYDIFLPVLKNISRVNKQTAYPDITYKKDGVFFSQ